MSGISTTIGLNISGFLGPLQTLSFELQKFQGLFMAMQTGFQGMLAIGSTAASALAAPFHLAGEAIDKAADMQSLETAFGTLTGDMKSGLALVGELQQLGAETPFEVLSDLAPAGKSLLAFGESAAQIPDTLRRIGDIASGVGSGINDLAQIYGKARTQGTLYAEDINQLTGRGIPIIAEFAKQLGVSEGAVKKMASEGKITFSNLERAFQSLTMEGGKFNGMMEAQSKTWNGLKSNLADTVAQIEVAFGKPLVEGLSGAFQQVVADLGSYQQTAAQLGGTIGNLITSGFSLAQTFGSVISAVSPLVPGLAAVALGFVTVKIAGSSTATTLRNNITALAVAIRSPGDALQGLRVQWQATLAGMQTATTGAAAAMRTALLSIGIGALLSAATYAFSYYMDRTQALKSGASALSDIGDAFDKQMKGNFRDTRGVSNESERLKLLENLNGQLDEMRDKQARVYRDFDHLGDTREADRMRDGIHEQYDLQAQLLEAQIRKVRALSAEEMRRAAIAKQTTKATQDQTKALEDLEKAHKDLREKAEKVAFDLLSPEDQRTKLVKDSRLSSVAQIDSEIQKAETKRKDGRLTNPEDIARAARLIELRKQLYDVEKAIRTEKEKADKKAKEDAEKLAKDKQEAHDFEREGLLELARLKAKANGDKAGVEKIEAQQRYNELFKQAQGANLGTMQADSYARSQLAAEQKAKAAEDKEKPTLSRVSADADRRVGLGGAAAGGNVILKESQKQTRELERHTRLLEKIEQAGKKQPERTPPAKAVFGRG
ncbi:tape measure protein [Verrucomicrobiota bacterium sgz303538]